MPFDWQDKSLIPDWRGALEQKLRNAAQTPEELASAVMAYASERESALVELFSQAGKQWKPDDKSIGVVEGILFYD